MMLRLFYQTTVSDRASYNAYFALFFAGCSNLAIGDSLLSQLSRGWISKNVDERNPSDQSTWEQFSSLMACSVADVRKPRYSDADTRDTRCVISPEFSGSWLAFVSKLPKDFAIHSAQADIDLWANRGRYVSS